MLRKGAGHFEDTSIWAGNVCVAAHNRGVNDHFGEIHTLDVGDEITLTTRLGTRTYAVTSVNMSKHIKGRLFYCNRRHTHDMKQRILSFFWLC